MDAETVILIVLAIFTLVAIAAFQRFKRVKTGIRGPGGLGLDLQGR
ncbi:MAG TPA: hypothetical protein VNJ70_10440 [Thermoanaerobaculia bacterium]|nr:hypothetical protein [Thermoanaerobaculia bacterium]